MTNTTCYFLSIARLWKERSFFIFFIQNGITYTNYNKYLLAVKCFLLLLNHKKFSLHLQSQVWPLFTFWLAIFILILTFIFWRWQLRSIWTRGGPTCAWPARLWPTGSPISTTMTPGTRSRGKRCSLSSVSLRVVRNTNFDDGASSSGSEKFQR